jgi:hypothetical protein
MKADHTRDSLEELLKKNPKSESARSDIEKAQAIVRSLREMGLGSESYGLGSAFGDRDWLHAPRRVRDTATHVRK